MKKTLNLVRRSLFLISMPMVFITFALPLRAEDLGASGLEIGALYSIFTASVFVVRPIVGFGLDHFGRRWFFIIAMMLYFGADALYALSTNIDTLYLARLVQGLGFSILSITTDTITADLTESDGRGAAMGGNIASQTRGGMLGAFVGFTLVGAVPLHAWVYSFSTFAFVALLAVIFTFQAIPETLRGERVKHSEFSFRFPESHYRLLAVIFLAAFAGAVIQPYYLIYLRGLFDLELAALAFAFLPVGIAYAVMPVWLGGVTNWLSRSAAMSIGLAMAGILYLFVPQLNGFLLIIAAFTGASIGSVLVDLTKNAWLADISGPQAAGRTFGVAALAAGAGATLGPIAGGMLYDGWGKETIFYVAGIILLGAMGLIFSNTIKKSGTANSM